MTTKFQNNPIIPLQARAVTRTCALYFNQGRHLCLIQGKHIVRPHQKLTGFILVISSRQPPHLELIQCVSIELEHLQGSWCYALDTLGIHLWSTECEQMLAQYPKSIGFNLSPPPRYPPNFKAIWLVLLELECLQENLCGRYIYNQLNVNTW